MQNRNSSAMDIHKLPDCTDFIWRSNHMSKTAANAASKLLFQRQHCANCRNDCRNHHQHLKRNCSENTADRAASHLFPRLSIGKNQHNTY